jgi:anti-sigma B factor antagonist
MKLVEISQAQGKKPVTVLRLMDRINLGNAAEVEKAAGEAIAGGCQDMVIDLSEAQSITSAGIRVLVTIYKQLSGPVQGGEHLKLVCPTPYVSEVLKIAGLLDYICVYDDLKSAVDSF